MCESFSTRTVRGGAPSCDPLSAFLIDDKEKYLQAEFVWFTLRKSLQTNLLITPLNTTTTMGRGSMGVVSRNYQRVFRYLWRETVESINLILIYLIK